MIDAAHGPGGAVAIMLHRTFDGGPALNVGLDLSSEPARPTGVGRYAVSLAGALAALERPDARFVAFGPRPLRVAGLPWVVTPCGRRSYASRRLCQQAVVPVRAARRRIDVLHSVNHLVPLAWRGPRVVTFHDAKLFDAAANAGRLTRAYRRDLHRLCAGIADLVVAPSSWAKAEAVRSMGVAPERVRVVGHGVDAARFERADPEADRRVRDRLGLGAAPYALQVATHEPAKNVDGVLRAFAQFARERPSLRLVLCGGAGWGEQRPRELARSLGVEDRLSLLGYVGHADLPPLYRGAAVFLFPSFVEGFGLPILEALAAGTPVVTSDRTACPETAGEAALLADPSDPAAIARQAERALSEPSLRRDLVERGRERARALTWERTALRMLEVYREAAAGARDRGRDGAGVGGPR